MSGLSVAAKNILREIACMSYGSREGTKGGRGNLGILTLSDGKIRIVKFNTHGEKSGGDAAITSSDRLRTLLHDLSLEANLDEGAQRRIEGLLQVARDGTLRSGRKLLDRTIAASVVELIAGKDIWKEVLAVYRKDKYTSASKTDFDIVKVGEDTANARTLGAVGRHTAEKIGELREGAVFPFYGKCDASGPYDKICGLMKRVIPPAGTFTNALAKMSCSSEELKALMGRCALRLQAVKYRACHTAEETAAFVKGRLERCAPGSTAEEILSDLDGVLKFCVDNGGGEDGLLVDCLREMMLAELTGSGASDDIHTTQVSFNGVVRDCTGSANALKALKTVLGKSEEQPKDIPSARPRLRTIAPDGNLSGDVAEKVHERLCKLLADGQPIADRVSRLGGSPAEIKESIRRNLEQDKDLMPRPANIGKLVENLGAEARKSQKKDVVGNAVGFHKEFLRKMGSSDVLGKYTVNGKPVPVGEAEVQALEGKAETSKPGRVRVTYSNDGKGGLAHEVSKDALAFMRQLEQLVPDPKKRHFLTMLMGMESPSAMMAFQRPRMFGYPFDSEGVFGMIGRGYSEMSDADDSRYDLTVEGDALVLRERINVSPSLGRLLLPGGEDVTLGQGGKNKPIPVLSNWYEITTRIDLSKPVDADGIPVFSQTVVSEKTIAYENMEMFARTADEHQEAGDFYVRLSADGTRLESAGQRNILRGSASEAENNRVRDFLKGCIIAYYGSEAGIPAEVKAQMTNFNGGGHPLSAKRIGLIWNAIQLNRIGKMSPNELRDDPYVARTLMRNGRQFKCQDATINGWSRRFTPWATEKDPEFFRKDCEKNVRPRAFFEWIKALRDELRPGVEGRPFEKDILRTTSFAYGSGPRVSYQDISAKTKSPVERLRRRAENDIASFVTGGKVRDFRKLDHGQRNLALFVKANMSQELSCLSAYGVHDRNENEFEFPRNPDTAVLRYSVDFTPDGGLVFRFVKSIEIKGVIYKGSDDFERSFNSTDGKSRKLYEEVTVSYSKEEVENIEKANFEELQKVFRDYGKRQDERRDSATIEKDVRAHLPKEFLVNPKVELNFAFDIDG